MERSKRPRVDTEVEGRQRSSSGRRSRLEQEAWTKVEYTSWPQPQSLQKCCCQRSLLRAIHCEGTPLKHSSPRKP
eukprot:7511032-Lingulodinium_polyedra.AAC.1